METAGQGEALPYMAEPVEARAMGIDINGWVEVWSPPRLIYKSEGPGGDWYATIDVGWLLIRNSLVYDCLFGVRGFGIFPPLVPERGLPEDCSSKLQPYRALRPPWPSTFHNPTWVTWAELQAADWEEETPLDRTRLHSYSRDDAGQWVADRAAFIDDHFKTQFAPLVGLEPRVAYDHEFPLGQEWEVGGKLYRMEKERRKDTLSWDWYIVFDLMAVLARTHGDDGVRLVVWFDY
jgi:hypothetical protein